MTLDEFQNNKTFKLEGAKWRMTPLGNTIMSVLQDEYRKLGFRGITAGFSDVDKAEHLGAIQGFNKALHTLDMMFAEPKAPPRDIPSMYADPNAPVVTKTERNKK